MDELQTCPGCGASYYIILETGSCLCHDCGEEFEPVEHHDRLEPLALEYAKVCGFALPIVAGAHRDLRAPGFVAFWVKDRSNEAARLGVLIHDDVGVVQEFSADEHPVGVLPAEGGFKALVLED